MSVSCRALLLALTVCLLGWAPAVRAADVVCHASADYFVIERETGALGRDFLIKPRHVIHAIPACFYATAPADFEIRNEAAEYFLALQGHYLILDSGTAPEPRGLIVWDLRQRRKIFAGTYASPFAIKPGHLEYWLESAAATDRNCPARQQWATLGLGAAVETQVRLRLADAQILRSRRTRCSQRQ
jgi:hypothetical protein